VGVVVTDVPRRDHYYAEYTSELVPDEPVAAVRTPNGQPAQAKRKAAI
jgi:hypothetical protein